MRQLKITNKITARESLSLDKYLNDIGKIPMLTADDEATLAKAIREGLLTVLSEIEGGTFQFSTALEDIHMNVEARLKDIIGEPAGRLHTGRSRNDQVSTDFKLWVRDQLDATEAGLLALIRALLGQAEMGARHHTS